MKKLRLITIDDINNVLNEKWPVGNGLPQSHYKVQSDVSIYELFVEYVEYRDEWPTIYTDIEVARFLFERFPHIEKLRFGNPLYFDKWHFEEQAKRYLSML